MLTSKVPIWFTTSADMHLCLLTYNNDGRQYCLCIHDHDTTDCALTKVVTMLNPSIICLNRLGSKLFEHSL